MHQWQTAWVAALFMIVLASWFLYRYVAPKRWRDWSRAALVQAFIISFYAEMYGFPVTLYILTRVFNIDLPFVHQTAPLWANLMGLGPKEANIEMMVGMAVGYAFVLLGIVMLIEGWREVYTARQQQRLAVDGLYGIVRHPQYTGIFLILFGEGVVHWPTLLSLIFFPIIVFAYVRLAYKEEAELVAQYGERYATYQRQVPMFFPNKAGWRRLLSGRLRSETHTTRRHSHRHP